MHFGDLHSVFPCEEGAHVSWGGVSHLPGSAASGVWGAPTLGGIHPGIPIPKGSQPGPCPRYSTLTSTDVPSVVPTAQRVHRVGSRLTSSFSFSSPEQVRASLQTTKKLWPPHSDSTVATCLRLLRTPLGGVSTTDHAGHCTMLAYSSFVLLPDRRTSHPSPHLLTVKVSPMGSHIV